MKSDSLYKYFDLQFWITKLYKYVLIWIFDPESNKVLHVLAQHKWISK